MASPLPDSPASASRQQPVPELASLPPQASSPHSLPPSPSSEPPSHPPHPTESAEPSPLLALHQPLEPAQNLQALEAPEVAPADPLPSSEAPPPPTSTAPDSDRKTAGSFQDTCSARSHKSPSLHPPCPHSKANRPTGSQPMASLRNPQNPSSILHTTSSLPPSPPSDPCATPRPASSGPTKDACCSFPKTSSAPPSNCPSGFAPKASPPSPKAHSPPLGSPDTSQSPHQTRPPNPPP